MSSEEMGTVTSIHDIARAARISIGTVDRVLHNRGRVAKATRARVMAIVRRLGYTPNIYARHLSLGRSFTFGVLIPELRQDGRYWVLPARGIKRAEEELRPYKVHIRVFHFDRYSVQSFCAAARLHDGGGGRFDDDRRAADLMTEPQVLA